MTKILAQSLRVLCIFALLSIVSVAHSYADNGQKKQTDEEKYVKPMPEIDFLSTEAFKGATTSHNVVPYGDKSLSFTVRLPKEWKEVEHVDGHDKPTGESFNRKIFGEIIKYLGPVGKQSGYPSRFFVQAEALSYEMSAEQWLMQFLLSHGYPLQGFQTYSSTRAEALYVVLEGDVSYIVRSLVMRSGKRMIIAQHYMPIEFWETHKALQAQTMASFQLGQEEKELIEPMKAYHFLDVAKIEYPLSWQLRAEPVRNIDRMRVAILNIPKQQFKRGEYVLDGKIEVSLVSVFEGEGLEKEVEALKERLSESSLSIGEPIALDFEPATNATFDFADTKIYHAVDENNKLVDYEYWLSIMAAEDYYYFMTMISPSRDHDLESWTRNSEMYKLMLSKVEPQGANFEL